MVIAKLYLVGIISIAVSVLHTSAALVYHLSFVYSFEEKRRGGHVERITTSGRKNIDNQAVLET